MSNVILKSYKPFSDSSFCLTPKEAARKLRISRTKMYQLLRQGDIPSVRIGRRILILEEELTNWLRKQSTSKSGRKRGDANGKQAETSF